MSAYDQEHNSLPEGSQPSPERLPAFSPEDGDEEAQEDFWSGEDLERAYQEAISALDHVEQTLSPAKPLALYDGGDSAEDDPADAVHSLNEFPAINPPAPPKAKGTASPAEEQTAPRVQPAQIIEAALFVGGMPLTVKRLANVLRDEFDREFIERTIDELNLRYDDEHRPYEIRLEEGGYRMVLRPEFENVRNKSYGFGPKEVRLSQEALEVLALIAYHQPITKEDIEKAGKAHPNGVLRQLLRREIIGLERTGKSAKEVSYHTTARFLQIFGLADLSELPRGEDLHFK